jgi:hypothetical protein
VGNHCDCDQDANGQADKRWCMMVLGLEREGA